MTLADGHPANAASARPSSLDQRPAALRLMGLLAISLALSILIEWAGMTFLWEELGAQHSARMLEREVAFVHQDFKEAVFGVSPGHRVVVWAGASYAVLFEWTGLAIAARWLGAQLGVDRYMRAALTMAQLFFTRLAILTFSLPIFVLLAIVGFASGLTLRDIRRWSGGREFGGIYHLAKRLAPRALVIAWICYLTVPISLHPNLVILPCAVLFGLNVLIVSASFKKYL